MASSGMGFSSMTKTYVWEVGRLIKLSTELKPFDKPIDSFREWGFWVWETDITLDTLIEHIERIQDADLTKPVILTADGWIMDGAHRLVKARLEGHDPNLKEPHLVPLSPR